jgi:hypothetical protein
MSIDLSSYATIEAGIFVKMEGKDFTWLFSDYIRSVAIEGDTYVGLGRLLGVTASSSDLKATTNDLTIMVSGVPNTSLTEVLAAQVKGADITVYRAVFNKSTGALLSIAGNPMSRYVGFVTNYSITEEYDNTARTATSSIIFTCASKLEVLGNTASGRRTNPDDQKIYYPSDLSMDRVPTLVGSNFNFGAPQ